jgi:predicted acyl esterase
MLRVRTVDGGFRDRGEQGWPIPRTAWTTLYLDPSADALAAAPPGHRVEQSFRALEDPGITMSTAPFEAETEVTGPVAARLFVASSTTDADIFCVLRVFDPDGAEVVFPGAVDPHTPVGHGWLRASHRKLDTELSTPWRPYHAHDEVQPLTPGEVYLLDVEIWPTSIVIPAGYRLALTVRGRDYEYEGADRPETLSHFAGSSMRGVGIYTHNDPVNRPADVYGGSTTLVAGPAHEAFVLLPVIPTEAG